ncbi:MAG: hypothetical protein V7772_11510 [Pseudomonas profundi]|uniref:hypothetical protein n=1 Tax=Pseudomonas profundi TaxID=1981513 RepID=UPI0030033485
MIPFVLAAKVLAVTATAAATAYSAKKLHDAKGSRAGTETESEQEPVQQSQSDSNEQRRKQMQSMLNVGLQQLGKDYLGVKLPPDAFDDMRVSAFCDCLVEDRLTAEAAMTVLCGRPLKVTDTADSSEARVELRVLQSLEKWIEKV